MAIGNSRESLANNQDWLCANRGRLDGVLQILRYNTHYYAGSLVALLVVAALLWLHWLPRLIQATLFGVAGVAVFWSVSSLIVSYYVYDWAALTQWNWLPQMLRHRPRRWLNIHAGLDQSTEILMRLFPETDYVVLDIYDSQEMTEPSIARARRAPPSQYSAVPCRLDALPVPDRDRDTVFLLFAAHEIRNPTRRIAFFRQAARLLTTSGQVLLVEHLRDWKNFVAFGPGCLHFYSRREWLRIIRESGFRVEQEGCVTPFVRRFLMSRPTG